VVGGRESDGVSAVGFAGSRGALRKWWVVGGGRSGVAMRLLLAIFAVVGLHYISEQQSRAGQDADEPNLQLEVPPGQVEDS